MYKTRALATAACKAGKVKIDDAKVKPARTVTPGDVVTARKDGVVRTVKVIALQDKRVGAKLVPDYCGRNQGACQWMFPTGDPGGPSEIQPTNQKDKSVIFAF